MPHSTGLQHLELKIYQYKLKKKISDLKIHLRVATGFYLSMELNNSDYNKEVLLDSFI